MVVNGEMVRKLAASWSINEFSVPSIFLHEICIHHQVKVALIHKMIRNPQIETLYNKFQFLKKMWINKNGLRIAV